MNILFVEIDTEATWAVCSLGPAFLATLARSKGHSAELLRIAHDLPIDQAVADIQRRAPDLVGFSMTTRQWLRGRAVANALRAASDIPVIAGGLHPTFSPEWVLAEPGFDAVCLGEGERPFAALLDHLSTGGRLTEAKIQAIWVKGGSHPGLGAPVEDVNALPWMARDMLDEQYGVVHMTTQRGCPFPCTYCAARMFDQLYDGIGKYGRRRSVESVMTELEAIRAAGPLNYIFFLDDTFTINHPWVLEFCEVFPKRIGIGFSLHARADTMKPALIEALARAGCRHIVYGVESGSERVRREIMQRPIRNERMIEIFRLTQEAGIMVTANYMLGLPGETKSEMYETIALHKELKPVGFGTAVFYPFPGTPLFQTCRDAGYLPENWLDLPVSYEQTILNLPGITNDDLEEVQVVWRQVLAEDQARQIAEAG